MSTMKQGTAKRVVRLGALLALILVGVVSLAGVAQADPANENTFTFDVLCEGQPVTITGMMAAHPPSTNGSAGHVVGSTSVAVLMSLSVRNLLTGDDTVIFSKPVAERQELTTCTYTFEPLLPPFLLFTAGVLLTPRS